MARRLRRQRRFDEAIKSFKEVIVLSQSHKTAIEIVKQAALELSEAQISIAAEFQREKETLRADQARLLQDIARFQNTAEEEKKILTANLQAEKDSLIAERARLLTRDAQLQRRIKNPFACKYDRQTLTSDS